MILKIILYAIACIFSTTFYAQKKVYVYFKSNLSAAIYHEEKHLFYTTLFGKNYDVILVPTLKNLGDFDFLITDEVPRDDQELAYLATYPKEKLLLFSFESPIIELRSFDPNYHHYYAKVFTWHDDFIDNKRYFKVRFPWMDPRPMVSNLPPFEERNLCVLVANQTSLRASGYRERRSIIKFFGKLGTQEFDLYGAGWNIHDYPCYKGAIQAGPLRRLNKIDTLKKYKFDICYENAIGYNGWVSERIFEAFAAGCIPVYWGAPNVTDYIPKTCFIDRRDFKSDQDLYLFLKNMTKQTYMNYIQAIQEYVASDAAYRASTPYYISCIQTILGINL